MLPLQQMISPRLFAYLEWTQREGFVGFLFVQAIAQGFIDGTDEG